MGLGRSLAIAAGIAVVAGFATGLAVGSSPDPSELSAARKLPADLCSRLGDLSSLFPRGAGSTRLAQTGVGDVRCRADVDAKTQPTYTAAELNVTVTAHAAKVGSSADQVAQRVFDGKPWVAVQDRPYPTKILRSPYGEEHWELKAITVRGDVVVEVDYVAFPVVRETAEQAILVVADRAIWETK